MFPAPGPSFAHSSLVSLLTLPIKPQRIYSVDTKSSLDVIVYLTVQLQ
jgi:hypothetical protein